MYYNEMHFWQQNCPSFYREEISYHCNAVYASASTGFEFRAGISSLNL